MSAYIAIKEIVTLTLHTRTVHKINYIELQCSAAKIYTIKLPCFQCVNVLVHTTEHQMKIYLSIHHFWNDLSRCRATYLLTPVLTGVPSFSDLHHNRTSSWSRTMAAHIFHQLPITVISDQWSVWDLYPQTHNQHTESSRNSGTILIYTDKFWQKWKHSLCFYSFHYIFLFSRIQTYINEVQLQDS